MKNYSRFSTALFILAVIALAVIALPRQAAGAQSSPKVFTPVADAFIEQKHPQTNYGTRNTLSIDGSPIVRSYLKFNVSGLNGAPITGARLRFYATDNSPQGFSVAKAISSSWSEKAITFNNSPSFGSPIGRTSALKARQWVEIDITGAVTGEGLVTLVLASTEDATTAVSSREAGANAPQLVLTLGTAAVIPAATGAPLLSSTKTPTRPPVIASTPTLSPTQAGTPFFSTNSTYPWDSTSCTPPYTASGPWNVPIPSTARTHQYSPQMITALRGLFGSDPNAYTYPVYYVDGATPIKQMRFTGFYKEIYNNDTQYHFTSGPGYISVPIPDGTNVSAATGTDSQLIIINAATGEEWSFWRAYKDDPTNPRSNWYATNAYKYNIKWDGYPLRRFSRGAGVPYLEGLVRPCEVYQGEIKHALAFAFNYPCTQATCGTYPTPQPKCVYPATSTDAKIWATPYPNASFPEGSRLQLNPGASQSQIDSWCRVDGTNIKTLDEARTCKILVKAMQTYGMYAVDQSGHPKIYAEYNGTAHWGQTVNGVKIPDLSSRTVANIPLSQFRVLEFDTSKTCPLP